MVKPRNIQFCGSGRFVTTKFKDMFLCSFSQEDILVMQTNLGTDNWVHLDFKAKKSPQNRNTHYGSINEYKLKD